MDITVRGANLAAIVCCQQLVADGHSVRLQVPPGARLGGHFAGIDFKGKKIDLGMVLLEPRFSDVQSPITDYDGESGSASNAFNKVVFDWLKASEVELTEVTVISLLNGKTFLDFLIADGLFALDELSNISLIEIVETARNCLQYSEFHPRNKSNLYFSQSSVSEVFPALYGKKFSEFLLALLDKIAGEQSRQLTSRYHRLLWLPLYFPETLLEYLEQKNSRLENLKFFTPTRGGVSGLLQEMLDKLKKDSHFDLLIDNQSLLDNEVLVSTDYKRCSISFVDESLLSEADAQIAKSNIAFLVYNETTGIERKVVHNLGSEEKWFRISQSLSVANTVVVELGYIEEGTSNQLLCDWGSIALEQNQINSQSEPLILRTQIKFPTDARPIQKKRQVKMGYYCTYMDSRSFNNQVVLGLKAAADCEAKGKL